MFTGLVEELGTIISIVRGTDSARLVIGADLVLEDIKIGDSIAVNGVCLTAVKFGKGYLEADVMAETLVKTNLNILRPGDRVNLERALKLCERLGGHIVTGHIDCQGSIVGIERHDNSILVKISAPADFMRYIIKKGSVSIDGVSLTVMDFNKDSFVVSLIPHTAHMTTLGHRKPDSKVNLEADIVGKYIERLLLFKEPGKRELADTGISMEMLVDKGFIGQ